MKFIIAFAHVTFALFTGLIVSLTLALYGGAAKTLDPAIRAMFIMAGINLFIWCFNYLLEIWTMFYHPKKKG